MKGIKVGRIPHPSEFNKEFKDMCADCGDIEKISARYRGDSVEKSHLFHFHPKSKQAHKKYHPHMGPSRFH